MESIIKADVEAAFQLLGALREYLMVLQTMGLLWWAMALI